MSTSARRHKKPSFKDEAIDVNELANMSNMKGMLSFLDTKPEDYARLFAKAESGASLPQVLEHPSNTESLPSSHLLPDSTLQPDSNLPLGSSLPPDGRLPPGGGLVSGSNLRSGSNLQAGGNVPPGSDLHSYVNSPPRDRRGLQHIRSLLSGSDFLSTDPAVPVEKDAPRSLPDGDLPIGDLDRSDFTCDESVTRVLPDGRLLPGSDLPSNKPFPDSDQNPHAPASHANTESPPDWQSLNASTEAGMPVRTEGDKRSQSGSKLLSGRDLVTANGRTVRIRIAKSVQDAHTSGEHLLLTSMWKKGSPQSEDIRLLKAGMAELARWTGSHKTSCRAHLRALMAKLAIEEAETFDAAAGKEGARVYRIFSFNAILERRRRANMTHVIRTGAVSFVDPQTGEKLLPDSHLLPGSSFNPDSNLLPASNLRPESGSNYGTIPGSNQAPPSINKHIEEKIRTTSSSAVVQMIQHTFGFADDAAARLITNACRAQTLDATDEEIAYFIQLHGGRIRKMRNVDNPLGLLIHYIPKCFEGEAFRQFREAERQRREAEENRRKETVAECQRILADPSVSEIDRTWAEQTLQFLES